MSTRQYWFTWFAGLALVIPTFWVHGDADVALNAVAWGLWLSLWIDAGFTIWKSVRDR